jgi:hypothetical protein
MKILLGPGDVLAPLLTCTTMAAGGFTAHGSDKLLGVGGCDRYLAGGGIGSHKSGHQNQQPKAYPASVNREPPINSGNEGNDLAQAA